MPSKQLRLQPSTSEMLESTRRTSLTAPLATNINVSAMNPALVTRVSVVAALLVLALVIGASVAMVVRRAVRVVVAASAVVGARHCPAGSILNKRHFVCQFCAVLSSDCNAASANSRHSVFELYCTYPNAPHSA